MPIDPEKARTFIARQKAERLALYGGNQVGIGQYGLYGATVRRYDVYQDQQTQDYFLVLGKDMDGDMVEKPFDPTSSYADLFTYDESILDFSKRQPIPLSLPPVDTTAHPQRRWSVTQEAIERAREAGENPEEKRRSFLALARKQAIEGGMHFEGFVAWASREMTKIYPVFRRKGRYSEPFVSFGAGLVASIHFEKMPENARFLTVSEYSNGFTSSPDRRAGSL